VSMCDTVHDCCLQDTASCYKDCSERVRSAETFIAQFHRRSFAALALASDKTSLLVRSEHTQAHVLDEPATVGDILYGHLL
jgi:hypothetical protein